MNFRSAHEQQFDQIVESYGSFVRQTILRICPRDLGLSHEEIEQDARLRLWKALESGREIKDPGAYLYRIAITATLDAIRRVKRKREEQLIEEFLTDGTESRPGHQVLANPASAPDREAMRKQIVQKVKVAVARLPLNRRQAVMLYLNGLSSQEIADLLNWTEPKARNLLYRGLVTVRDYLREEGIEYEID